MQNITIMYNCTQARDDQRDPMFDFLIYLFAEICAQNQPCRGTFRILFGIMFEFFSVMIAALPVMNIKSDYSASTSAITATKAAMVFSWSASNLLAVKAAQDMYHDMLPEPDSASSMQQFDAGTNAFFGFAFTAAITTGFAACIVSAVRPTSAYLSDKCSGISSYRNSSYRNLLDDNNGSRSRLDCC